MKQTKISLRAWIKANRVELDKCIKRACPNTRLDDEQRRLWVLNDEGLYNWARSEGARV